MTDSIEELATKLEEIATGELPAMPATLRAAALKLRECREALEPFAEAGKVKLCGGDFWTDDKSINNTDVAFYVKFGDLRRAAKALEAK